MIESVAALETHVLGCRDLVDDIRVLRAGLVAHHQVEENFEFAGLRIQLGSRQLQRMGNATRLAAALSTLPPDVTRGHGESFVDLVAAAARTICLIDDDDR